MKIRAKLSLLMGAFTLFALSLFSGSLYVFERREVRAQEIKRLSGVADALARVAEESIMSQDDLSLISYTLKLKSSEPLLEYAFVHDGEKYRAHTEKKLVLEKVSPAASAGGGDLEIISFPVSTGGKKYTVTTAFSRRLIDDDVGVRMTQSLRRMLFAGALALLAALAVSAAASRAITRPVLELSRAAAKVGGGDLNSAVAAPESGGDEIDLLRREFNGMVGRLMELDEMKKDFVSAVTHELKSPLSAIDSYLDIVLGEVSSGLKGDEARVKWAEDINYAKQNVKRLHNFIGTVLDAAKIEKGKFEIKPAPFDFSGLAGEVVKLFSGKAAELNVALGADPGFPAAVINADRERMRQVLVNLVSNALKFTPAGGRVLLKARVTDGLDLARHAAVFVPGEKYFHVSVEDSGAGIPAEALPRLFGKFEQVKTTRGAVRGDKGAGLGLYIARTIVEGHGGAIWAESAEGKGSAFNFALSADI